MGRSSIFTSGTISFKASITLMPLTRWFRLKEKSTSENICFLLRPNIHFFTSSSLPAAYMPPIKEPIEQPATEVMLKPLRSNSSMAPICAKPRAPPLDNTNATFLFISILFFVCKPYDPVSVRCFASSIACFYASPVFSRFSGFNCMRSLYLSA